MGTRPTGTVGDGVEFFKNCAGTVGDGYKSIGDGWGWGEKFVPEQLSSVHANSVRFYQYEVFASQGLSAGIPR